MSTATLSRPDCHDVRDADVLRVAVNLLDAPMLEPDISDLYFVHGDDTALRRAYDQHGSLVYSLCRRAVGAELANDITQEVFVTAWKRRAMFDPERGALGAWLTGITRNKIIDVVRREARHQHASTDGNEDRNHVAASVSDAEDIAVIGDRMLLVDALDHLSTRSQRVLRLAYIDDLTHQEIADHTGLPLGTIKSDIKRGLERLRRHLTVQEGGFS